MATEELFEVVNSYVLTTLSLRTPDKQRIMSMKVNHYENACGCYEFTQTCQLFDDVAYSLKPDELVSVRGEYNNKADAFYITCELKNGMELWLMIVNVSGSEEEIESDMRLMQPTIDENGYNPNLRHISFYQRRC